MTQLNESKSFKFKHSNSSKFKENEKYLEILYHSKKHNYFHWKLLKIANIISNYNIYITLTNLNTILCSLSITGQKQLSGDSLAHSLPSGSVRTFLLSRFLGERTHSDKL